MKIHVPLEKTPTITAGPFLLEYYRIFPGLYIDENTNMMHTKIHSLRNNV